MTTIGCENVQPILAHPVSAAVESAVDAYATRLLRKESPPEACIDDSLGPYVTSLLRCSLTSESDDVQELPEFDSLIELLIEHCNLNEKAAASALSTIAIAVTTGRMDILESTNADLPTCAESDPNATESHHPPISIYGKSDNNVTSQNDYYSSMPLEFEDTASLDIKCDKGISVCKTNDQTKNKFDVALEAEVEAFPPLGAKVALKKHGKPPRKPSKEESKDIATTLFRPSRSRQPSIDEDGYSSSSTNQTPRLSSTEYQHQLDSVTEILLSMNPDLSEAAAVAASSLAGGDINLAQYIIDQAMSAQPVCRHMLNDGCYRSDCQFSHDVEGHTCLFWIRGRCGKGESCRFYHGFSGRLTEGIGRHILATNHAENMNLDVATKNLLSHNSEANNITSGSWSPATFTSSPPFSVYSNNLQSSLKAESSQLADDMAPKFEEIQNRNSSFSFARIASAGISNDDPFIIESSNKDVSFAATDMSSSRQKQKFVKIPQNLWNHHVNRDAGAFYISDPIERYLEVSKTSGRRNVIDLHFQSTKTFSVVLATILPEKLLEHDDVWIVTGSGHHVNRNSHQKGGGALESAVLAWLDAENYMHLRGRDRNGHSGAVLVNRAR
mmetsp:Transcript_14995/g.23047  ORF Transcript_14995/g.23047 Transcript_14995/m.23047 type:complete len:613 (-) Transcript_14995:10-1848(-)